MENALIYSYDLAQCEYGSNHPFKPVRAKLFVDLLHRYCLIHESNQKMVEPQPLDEELFYLFHEKSYIELIKKADHGEFGLDMLYAELGTGDNPIFKGMYHFALMVAGATYLGATMLAKDEARMVFNPIGGLHHAEKDRAMGFCYVNDIAIAIAHLVREGFRVAYIDIDAHHGNGVQDAFYGTNKVLTISLHESGETLFPGTGFENEVGIEKGRGYNVNVPLRSGTDDEVYLYAFETIVPPLVKSFAPDIVFAEIGGDCHKDDPLAHLNLTSNGYGSAVRMIDELSPKLLATGGGGYNIFKTAALWTLAWAIFCGLQPVDQYAGVVGGMMFGPESEAGSLTDPPFVLSGKEKDLCFEQVERVIQYLKENVFPVHGL